MNEFDLKVRESIPGGLVSQEVEILQVNLGRTCNLSCMHCHLACSPQRCEQMPDEVMENLLCLTGSSSFRLVDITGGSPELHPKFRYFLNALADQECAIQVRTNLTNLVDPRHEDLIHLFMKHRISLVGSLPCYTLENVDSQRGDGVYNKIIDAIIGLNRIGYGVDKKLILNLAYNPGGSFLPPSQNELENMYRKKLKDRFGLAFTRLIVLTNMPIGRFRQYIEMSGELYSYMNTLKEAFNMLTLPHLMCRYQISVDWDGTIYDCDFNLALGIPINHGAPTYIEALDLGRMTSRTISTGNHCFGCTAGSGSSCSGILDKCHGF